MFRMFKTAIDNNNIPKVRIMVLKDRSIKVKKIADTMNISKERSCHILNQDLSVRKLLDPVCGHLTPTTIGNKSVLAPINFYRFTLGRENRLKKGKNCFRLGK